MECLGGLSLRSDDTEGKSESGSTLWCAGVVVASLPVRTPRRVRGREHDLGGAAKARRWRSGFWVENNGPGQRRSRGYRQRDPSSAFGSPAGWSSPRKTRMRRTFGQDPGGAARAGRRSYRLLTMRRRGLTWARLALGSLPLFGSVSSGRGGGRITRPPRHCLCVGI